MSQQKADCRNKLTWRQQVLAFSWQKVFRKHKKHWSFEHLHAKCEWPLCFLGENWSNWRVPGYLQRQRRWRCRRRLSLRRWCEPYPAYRSIQIGFSLDATAPRRRGSGRLTNRGTTGILSVNILHIPNNYCRQFPHFITTNYSYNLPHMYTYF